MTNLAGRGLLALWHRIALADRERFFDWHGREHFADRCSIPGFARARRWASLYDDTFLTFYELETLDVLQSDAYVSRQSATPTDAEREAFGALSDVTRLALRVVQSAGHADGGLLATARYRIANDDALQAANECASHVMSLARASGIAALHVLVDASDSATLVVMLEGWSDATHLAASLEDVTSAPALRAHGRAERGMYRLQASARRTT